MLFTAKREHHEPNQRLKELYSCHVSHSYLMYLIFSLIHVFPLFWAEEGEVHQKGRKIVKNFLSWHCIHTQESVALERKLPLSSPWCSVFCPVLIQCSSPCTATESTMGSISEVGLLEVALSFVHVLGPMAILQKSSCSEPTIAFSVTTAYLKKGNESKGANVLQHKPLLLSFSKENLKISFQMVQQFDIESYQCAGKHLN